MSVYLYSADIKNRDNQQIAINVLMRSESIHSFDIDRERSIVTVITNGNVPPLQIEEWMKEEGFQASFIRI
jgi:hypothetical protein